MDRSTEFSYDKERSKEKAESSIAFILEVTTTKRVVTSKPAFYKDQLYRRGSGRTYLCRFDSIQWVTHVRCFQLLFIPKPVRATEKKNPIFRKDTF